MAKYQNSLKLKYKKLLAHRPDNFWRIFFEWKKKPQRRRCSIEQHTARDLFVCHNNWLRLCYRFGDMAVATASYLFEISKRNTEITYCLRVCLRVVSKTKIMINSLNKTESHILYTKISSRVFFFIWNISAEPCGLYAYRLYFRIHKYRVNFLNEEKWEVERDREKNN